MKHKGMFRLGLLLLVVLAVFAVFYFFSAENALFSGLKGLSLNSNQKNAEELLNNRKFEEALSIYHQRITSGENTAKDYYGRGMALFGLRRFEEAIYDFTTALSFGQDAQILASRCTVYRIISNYEKALQDCQSAIQAQPDNVQALMALAVLYIEQGNYQLARETITKVLDLDPNFADGYFALARLQMAEGPSLDAIGTLTKAIELNPNVPEYYWERGFLYYSNAQIKESEADMRKILEIADPVADGEVMLKAGTLLNSYKGYLEGNP